MKEMQEDNRTEDGRSQRDRQTRAEASIIGSLLHNRSLIAELGDVGEEHFTVQAHRQAWTAVVRDPSIDDDLALQIAAPDLTDREAETIMRSKHHRDTVIRARDLVFESRTRRELRAVLVRSLEALDAEEQSAITIAMHAQEGIMSISSPDTESQEAGAVARTLGEQEKSEIIPTGIRAIDFATYGGIHMGQLLGVFGRFKAGKTVTAATIASNLERRGIQTLVVSLERRKHDVERFLVARSLGIDARDLDLKSDKDQKAQFAHYLEETRNLRYVHRPAISIEQLRTRIIAAVRAHGVRIVIVDYWQLITNKDSRQSQADKQQDAAQMLADIAATLDIGIIVMGQINQQGEPRGGEGILASAGIVIYIERPNMGDEGFIKAVVCNKGPVRNSGGPEEPSITLTQPGPHFTDMLSES